MNTRSTNAAPTILGSCGLPGTWGEPTPESQFREFRYSLMAFALSPVNTTTTTTNEGIPNHAKHSRNPRAGV
jgi:hypothetical protein